MGGYLIILLLVVHGCFEVRCETIWRCDDFPQGDSFGGCEWRRQGGYNWGVGNLASVSDPAGNSGRAVRIRYPKDSWVRHPSGGDMKGGIQFLAKPFSARDELTFEYEVFFHNNFDFVKGGKLPGLKGGTGSCSGGNQDDSCFSLRYMWRRDGDGEVYAYMPAEKGDWFCSRPENVCNFAYGHSLGRGTWRFQKNRWHKIAMYVRLNTPGSSDGMIRVRVDGSEVYSISGLQIRKDSGIKADQIYFSTFFGGSTQDWQSTVSTYTYYRKFKVIV